MTSRDHKGHARDPAKPQIRQHSPSWSRCGDLVILSPQVRILPGALRTVPDMNPVMFRKLTYGSRQRAAVVQGGPVGAPQGHTCGEDRALRAPELRAAREEPVTRSRHGLFVGCDRCH